MVLSRGREKFLKTSSLNVAYEMDYLEKIWTFRDKEVL